LSKQELRWMVYIATKSVEGIGYCDNAREKEQIKNFGSLQKGSVIEEGENRKGNFFVVPPMGLFPFAVHGIRMVLEMI
jgi:hypothetical protein